MGSDPHVIAADDLRFGFQGGADLAISLAGLNRQRHDPDEAGKLVQLLYCTRQGRRLLLDHPIYKLPIRDHRHDCIARVDLQKMSQDLRRPTAADVNADVGVEQKTRSHYSPFRFCGLSLRARSTASTSMGRSARSQKARSKPLVFSRSTTSSPRRKISTSSLWKRNSFGNLTAWLLPDLKTLAEAMAIIYVYPSSYIRWQGCERNISETR